MRSDVGIGPYGVAMTTVEAGNRKGRPYEAVSFAPLFPLFTKNFPLVALTHATIVGFPP